jgi:hypothetical protein
MVLELPIEEDRLEIVKLEVVRLVAVELIEFKFSVEVEPNEEKEAEGEFVDEL